MIVDKVEKVNELSLEEIRQKLPDGDDRAYLTENGTRYTVTLHNPTSIPEAAFAACFSLVETNMMKMYKAAECGWSASDKRVEMREPPTRYLIASPESAPDTVAGFVSYQIDWEEDVSVAYW
ncbi:N alpha-acetyl-transferase [Saitoella coloradoensis]